MGIVGQIVHWPIKVTPIGKTPVVVYSMAFCVIQPIKLGNWRTKKKNGIRPKDGGRLSARRVKIWIRCPRMIDQSIALHAPMMN